MVKSVRMLCLLLVSTTLLAQQAAPPKGGKFENLRFDEDWRFLSQPDAQTAHWMPYLKQIEVGDGWMLDLGGQERIRIHDEEGKNLSGAPHRNNDFRLYRTRLHADLRHEDGMRVFVELLDARIAGHERAPIAIDRQNLDVQNAFVEYSTGDGTWRAGRMELQYGAQRYISPLEWGNTRRRFEGLLMRQKHEDFKYDVFVTKPVPVDDRRTDHDDDSLWLSGLYATVPTGETSGVDLYGITLNESQKKAVAGDGTKGEFDIYTLGARHWARADSVDWEGEAAQQFGDFAGDSVEATSLAARVGVTGAELTGKPRLGLDLDWASGDSNPTDGQKETFNQLFPLAHAYFGALDLVGRQNITDVQPNLTLTVDERTNVRIEQHFFQLDERRDALYNAAGAPTLRDPTGGAGTDVGRELDVVLTRQLESLAPHGQVQVGWARFTPGDFVETLGSNQHVNLLYLQFLFTF